jgi:plasmid stabilization system protein ParE
MGRTKRVELVPEAIEEIRAAAGWYRVRSNEAVEGFRREVRSALRRIAQSPTVYQPYLRDTRWCRLRRFPYLIIFRENEHEIKVVAVPHERQHEGYWIGRVDGP